MVVHGSGVEIMVHGARDEAGQLYRPAIARLSEAGVSFRVCGNSLRNRRIAHERVVPEGRIVRAGSAELRRLQQEEGFVSLN